jgi:hypothetical protein
LAAINSLSLRARGERVGGERAGVRGTSARQLANHFILRVPLTLALSPLAALAGRGDRRSERVVEA